MAVRNIDAIERKTEQMASEKQQVADTRRAALKVYIDSISAKRQDMIDAVDTYYELAKRNIPREFESGTKIKFQRRQYNSGYKIVLSASCNGESASFAYSPKENEFEIDNKSLSKKFRSIDELSDNEIYQSMYQPKGMWKDRGECQRRAIQELAEGIEVFLNAFFNYVEHL